ncbi:hypothetical protein BO70DRAFT_89322 [Aspergillus heteromorphus CBS 117.55]|uniref:Uncharacterized protein n=1 Tax=Aspergillus heteromorphus CBS 117.55 TaxID=1448321 RepID=A0A317X152_9EURO|nr:uncharacterized protein BO70DRAFT_89322 [Aspergillus heteromorphus CBS 117.55]PWY91267.1 hypothetical protein BO70DRAFT_89322 [Aspergillus heteromorphus CBS 117.55]
MAPTKPILHPLTTPKNMTFPSELRERTFNCLDVDRPVSEKKEEDDEEEEEDEDDEEATITPPPAYTEFLNTFSPIFSSPSTSRANFYKYMRDKPRPSPTSPPASTTSTTFPSRIPPKNAVHHHQAPPASWATKSPVHTQRMRLPPPYICTPVSASPYTPSEWRQQRPFDSPVSETGNSFSVRHVVTTTITYKRTPQLDPPPQGKRRRNLSRRNT